MKALQVVRPRSFAVVEAPVPQLSSSSTDQLLIQTRWVSMCGSDIPFFTGSKRFKSYPLPPGVPIHECVGEIVESTSDLYKPGDHVIAIPDGNQGMAEFFVAQVARAAPLPADLASHDTSCLIQPLATVMNAVDSLKNIEGQAVAVIGWVQSGCSFAGCSRNVAQGALSGSIRQRIDVNWPKRWARLIPSHCAASKSFMPHGSAWASGTIPTFALRQSGTRWTR